VTTSQTSKVREDYGMKSTLTAPPARFRSAAVPQAFAQDAIQAPAQKTIGGTQDPYDRPY